MEKTRYRLDRCSSRAYHIALEDGLIEKAKSCTSRQMKYQITQFRSLAVAIKELEPFIRNGEHLRTGKPFEKLHGMRSREILANWLLCAAVNAIDGVELTFCSDPIGGDGIIRNAATGETWPTEHVMVPPLPEGQAGDAQALILDAIEQKRRKGGPAYARGKTLVVFFEAGTAAGKWLPNHIARQLPEPLDFDTVWVVALKGVEGGEYVYSVTHLDISRGNAPTLLVRINKEFDAWQVELPL
jgi:hypothetical protein